MTVGELPVVVTVVVVVAAVIRQFLAVIRSSLEGAFYESFLQALREATQSAKRKSFFIRKRMNVCCKYIDEPSS